MYKLGGTIVPPNLFFRSSSSKHGDNSAAIKLWNEMRSFAYQNGLWEDIERIEKSTQPYDIEFIDGAPSFKTGVDQKTGRKIAGAIPTISAEAANGLGYLKKLNAAQFSKTFKGNLSRLRPALRGKTNRFANYMIEKWNEYIPSGSIVTEAAGSLNGDDENEKK